MTSQEQPVGCLPNRVHDEDITGKIVLDDPGYQYLSMSVDEASVTRFEEIFRVRLNAGAPFVVVISNIYGE